MKLLQNDCMKLENSKQKKEASEATTKEYLVPKKRKLFYPKSSRVEKLAKHTELN